MNNEQHLKYILRLADNSFVLGHRLSELCSHGPYLEEDIAMTNISLDFLGQATALYKHAALIEGKGRTEDDLVYKRVERNFYNNQITELPNGDFGFTMARLFLMSEFNFLLLESLSKSKDEVIAAIAVKSLKEVKYHIRHSVAWVIRLGDGTEESHTRIQKSFNEMWMYTGELFAADELDIEMQKSGIGADLISLQNIWLKKVEVVLTEATLKLPEPEFMQNGSRKGVHTEHLGFMLAEIQYLPKTYPDAKW